jgi:hypothetical protein
VTSVRNEKGQVRELPDLTRLKAGWRRSADRTRLQANSLVSGNFTGNFAIPGLRDTMEDQETAALQPLPEQFPAQIIRENILRIREFF